MATLTDDGSRLNATAGQSGPFAVVRVIAKFAFYARSVRLFTICLGLAAVAWGAIAFPIFWRQRPVEDTAAAIIGRDAFKPHALARLLPAVAQIEQSRHCHPEALQSAAIIRLRLAEDAMASGKRTAIDGRLSQLENTTRLSLTCAPSDSFLWMALAWLDDARYGFRQQQLTYLRLSYELGRNEGWVAARRNRFALSMYGRLPPDLADTAVHEFARMVQSWIYRDTIAIFTGPGWPIRNRLLASLKEVGLAQREAFYIELYAEGYNVAVPGVKPHDPRPWY